MSSLIRSVPNSQTPNDVNENSPFSSQLQYFCVNIVKERLRRDGLLIRKISVAAGPPDYHSTIHSHTTRHVLAIINRMSIELERMHPRTFATISLSVPEVSPMVLENIAKNLFRNEAITWGSVISFMTISAALASDCVKTGQPDLVATIIEVTSNLLINEVGSWIEKKGGFDDLTEHIRPIAAEHLTFLGWLTYLVTFLLTVHWIVSIINAISKQFTKIL